MDLDRTVTFQVDVDSNNFRGHLIPVDKFSSFHKLVLVQRCVIIFINKLKHKLKLKNSQKYSHLNLSTLH